MRGLMIHKSRRAVMVPRRKASQENQAPTLIVKYFNSEYFIDRAEQVDKTNVLGSLCFAVKDKIFLSLSRVITAPDVVLVTHMQTEGPLACGM